MKKLLSLTGVSIALSAASPAVILTYVPFDGGAINSTLGDSNAIGSGAIGTTSTYSAFTNAANLSYVAGLSGSQSGNGNAILATPSSRTRIILDRQTAAWAGTGLVTGGANDIIGAGGLSGTIFGSVLIANPNGAPAGFTGLEFASGDPNANRVLTVGEAGATGDVVVIGSGVAGGSSELALPAANLTDTREVVFRIDYAANANDTFTLINPDGTDGAAASGSFEFSTLHLAAFSGGPAVVYDEIKLGTTLEDVTTPVPEPSTSFLGGLALLSLVARRRR